MAVQIETSPTLCRHEVLPSNAENFEQRAAASEAAAAENIDCQQSEQAGLGFPS